LANFELIAKKEIAMLLKRTNVEEKLRAYRKKIVSEEEIINEVYAILKADNEHEERISTLLSEGRGAIENHFNPDLLEAENVFHINQIKKICIDYRLRFLDTRYFKGKYPHSAISKIKGLEKLHKTELKGFKIVAPSKLFKLENADDPLLFAPIGNNYYYLVHKWGNDLHPLRKLQVLPFKNLGNLTVLLLLLSWLLTEMVPNGLFTNQTGASFYWVIYLFMFKTVASIALFYGFALGKNFNHAIWNSKYFNA